MNHDWFLIEKRNKTIIKRFLKDKWGNLSIDFIFDDIMELLLIFLGEIRIS